MRYQRLDLGQMLLDLMGLACRGHASLLHLPRTTGLRRPPAELASQAKCLDWIKACKVERETPRIFAMDAFETVLANRR